jgi:glutamate transport system permease protein
MSRALEDILFRDPSPKAQAVTRAVSAIVAAVLVAGIVYRFHAAGQFDPRLWEFFAWTTTWAFLASGLLGTLASAASAAVIALVLGLVLLAGRLSRLRLVRLPAWRSSSSCAACRRCCSSTCAFWFFRRPGSS